jgi:GGDEF domain-containing protein
MDSFREAYGFVASDDVLRAISLMISNTMRETSGTSDFLGHLSGTDFLLVAPPAAVPALQEKLRARLEQSMDYFYPIKDRDQASKRKDRLGVKIAEITSVRGNFTTVDQLKMELLRLKK